MNKNDELIARKMLSRFRAIQKSQPGKGKNKMIKYVAGFLFSEDVLPIYYKE